MLRRLFFNLKYFANPPWDTGISPPELLAFLDSHAPGRALDLGCGTGTNVLTLAQRGWQATGVDFAPKAIATGRRKLKQAGVQAGLRVGDVTKLRDLAGPFDLVLDIGCMHALSPDGRAAYRRNLARWLAPGGTFLLYTFIANPAYPGGPGIDQTDLDALCAELFLAHRADGTDHGARPSAWLTFTRPQ